ncbi:TraB/GumN family protein [Marinicella rhabdoformis]|uniref:TraB/GumN family protein n=1 Tax=Marinicella rhabdoformis TaxID=2580566 RepID=UPI0012AEC0AA|nr:TraB/GumN family protein [Marinicella rhabdoformis]
MKKYVLMIVTLMLSQWCQAEQVKQSMLWQVSGNGLEKPSYIFGNWHMLCRSQVIFKDKVKLAIADSKQFIFQNYFTYLSQEDYYDRQKTNDRLNKGVPIYKIKDRKKRKKILKLIDEHMDLKVDRLKRVMPLVKRMKPIEVFFSSTHSYIKGCHKLGSFDKMMFNHFKKDESPIASFGSRKEIWNGLQNSNFMSEDSLLHHLTHMKSQQEKVKDIMLAYYMDEDADKMKRLYHQFLMNDSVDSDVLDASVFDLDTLKWSEKIKTFMHNDSTLVSVNILYLNGEKGLINQFKEQGYQVTPL